MPSELNKKTGHHSFVLPVIAILTWLLSGASMAVAEPHGELIIFHAGSLSIPFQQISKAFTKKYPQVHILREAAGSRTCARKITDLGKPCDIMASADYTVIDNLLMPNFTAWDIAFATNEMAIMYRPDSKYAGEINEKNWPEVLLRKGVRYGHSDPNTDPCGYRSQLVWQLAENYYNKPGLYEKLKKSCPLQNIRPKETDLMALLESGELDYLFIYRSICEQHHMPFIALPDAINLKSAAMAEYYARASIKISGKKPGEYILKKGKPMVYGITVCTNAPNREAATAFVQFLIGPEGRAIMNKNGQPPLWPVRVSGNAKLLPDVLKNSIQTTH
ncbi:MAG TPA: tungstate ABC transporter substrate-binding protein WtpA [Desulfobulbaceae bacterium]|nr:tungstate ABC transporter substrate-binding protein WtpA [Desulfobulbaceae bacterium]